MRGLSDVGLLFLREPVHGMVPARLAPAGVLMTQQATQAPMTIVGYGLLDGLPEEKQAAAWDRQCIGTAVDTRNDGGAAAMRPPAPTFTISSSS